MAEIITSSANATVKIFKDLHRAKVRRANARTIVEGPLILLEFLDAGFVPERVVSLEDDQATTSLCLSRGIPLTYVAEHVLHAAAGTVSTPGPLAIVRIPEPKNLRLHNTLVLVDVSDPGNVGTMVRAAAAFGWDVATSGSTADLWSPKTIRSGAGAHVHARLIRLQNAMTEIDASGLEPIAMVVAGGESPRQRTQPVALLIGSESHGLPEWALPSEIERVSISMPGGIESLNAAVAAGIAMYALS